MKKGWDIDDLFRDHVPQIEHTPPPEVWQNIQSHFQKKEERKQVIPMWYSLGGVAAAIALVLVLATKFNEKTLDAPRITEEAPDKKESGSERFELHPVSEEKSSDVATRESHGKKNHPRTSEVPTPHHTSIKEEEARGETLVLSELHHQGVILTGIGWPGEEILLTSRYSSPTLTGQPLTIPNGNSGKEEKDPEFMNRFSIAPTVAAVYQGYLGKDHPVDPLFANKETREEVQLLYGIGLGYQLSADFSVRSGINKFSSAVETLEVNNISAVNAQAVSGNPSGTQHVPEGMGVLKQELAYLEIPLEMQYHVVQNKLGVSINFGGSLLLLEENRLHQYSTTYSSSLGPANNINKTSWSTNFGVGFKYQFYKSVQFQLQPSFKYHFNSFRNTSANNSFHLGIYSGLLFEL